MITTNDPTDIPYKQVLDHSLSGVLVYQVIRTEAGEPTDFRYRYANQRAADWLGLSIDELLTCSLGELYPTGNILFDQYVQVMRTGKSRRFAFERQPVRGLPLQWLDVQLEPFDDGVICSFVDITDYKLSEEARQVAHDLIEGIFDASPWAIVFLTPVLAHTGEVIDFVFNLANKAAVAVGGRPLDALLGNRMLEMYPATRTLGLFDQYVRVYQTGEPFETDVFYNSEDLTDWAHIVAVRQGDGIVLTNSTITARKQAEDQVSKKLNLLQRTEEVAGAGSWEYNRATGHFIWSPGMYRLFDLPPDTPVEPDVYIRYATDLSQSEAQRLVAYILEGQDSFDETLTIQTTEGVKTVKIKASIEVVDANGSLRVLGIDQDITAKLHTQTQLEQTALHLQAVLNASPASIAYFQAVRNPSGDVIDLRIMVANCQFAELSGKPLSDLPGTSVHQLAYMLWGSRTWYELIRVLETGEAHYEEQPQAIGTTKRWVALSVIRQEDGVVITGLDITELRHIQQQQEDLFRQVGQSVHTVGQLAQLQQQLRKRGELLRTSSHDLRGSLGIIQSAVGLLAFAHTDEDRTQMLEIIQRNAQETTRLIDDLLDYARLESGQESLHIASFDAGELLLRLGRNIESIVRNKGLEFRVEGPWSLPVEGDAVQVLRIAQNLLLNALKYTQIGTITLRWAANTPEEWYFSVADTGPGIPTERTRRFARDPANSNPHEDVSPSDRPSSANADLVLLPSTPGEGIGLQIVQQLTELMRGRLVIESGPEGSTFRVILPRQY